MTRFARWIEVALGLFFVAAAAAKAVDVEAFAVQISLYGVVKDPQLVRMAAYCTLIVETALGAALMAGLRLRGLVYAVSAALTLVFSGLIVYAWAFKGLKDCGCFGEYVQMTPAQSLLKNAVLLGLLGGAWYGTKGLATTVDAAGKALALRGATALAAFVVVLAAGFLGNADAPSNGPEAPVVPVVDKSRPFQKFQFEIDGIAYNLGEGQYLVALLSATCHHCQDSVEELNEFTLIPELPELVALVEGSPEELEEFRLITAPLFPTQLVQGLDFYQFIDSAPPRLMVVHEGRQVQGWEWEDEVPGLETVLHAVGSLESDEDV